MNIEKLSKLGTKNRRNMLQIENHKGGFCFERINA